jgi:hypothetical protein
MRNLSDLYSSPNMIRVTKSRRIGDAEQVARMEEKRGVYRDLVEELKGKKIL